MKYRKWSDTVEAIQFIDDSDRIAEISEFTGMDIIVDYEDSDNPILRFCAFNFEVGDWVIKYSSGELNMCKQKVFSSLYEKVD